MKSKRTVFLVVTLLFIASLVSVSGCGDGQVNVSGPAQASLTNDVSSSSSALETTATTASPPTLEPEVTSALLEKEYAKAYYDVITRLISQYGFYYDDADYEWGQMGFYRGDLIDFENDGIPELVCIYRREYFHNICIYRYTGNEAVLLADELAGDSILGDNWSDIRYNQTNRKPYALIQDCDWGEFERIKVFLIENGALITKIFTSDVTPEEDENGAPYVKYLTFHIDGREVTEDEYFKQKEYYLESAIWWAGLSEDGEYRAYEKDDAAKFVKMLAASAGVGEAQVNELLSAGPLPRELPPDWQYDLNSHGLYRTDLNTGTVTKINDQGYASGIIITDDWLYYRVNGCLYRMDNENRREQLTAEKCWFPSLCGGLIYYVDSRGIARMGLDGSGKEQIIECDCNEMVVTDNYIFYALNVPDVEELNSLPGAEDGPTYIGELRRIGLDGAGDMKIEGMISELSVNSNTVYFTEAEDARLYALDPVTLERKLFCDGLSIQDLYFGGGYAFFVLDRNVYKRALTDGTMTSLTQGAWDACLGVLDGYAYVYINAEELADMGVYRIPIDGIELEKIK